MKMRPFCFEDCLMPALFAYLLAVCIFLGGGYGALNWLATPEPAKVTVSAKHTPPRSAKVYDATTITEIASESGIPPVSPTTDLESPSKEAAKISEARSERDALERNPPTAQQPLRAVPVSHVAITALPNPVLKVDKRPHSKQANKHSPGKALELMTLRTIEFPDGHRVTQLLPYRKREQALAFQPDW
jgi:hypothetical protein